MASYPAASFAPSRLAFDQLVSTLATADALRMDHGALERHVEDRGREVMRQLVQDHLDLRAERERADVEPMCGADGHRRTEIRHGKRQLGTVFGDVVVHRLALVGHGVPGGLRPLDARLNLPRGRYSHGVEREIVWGVSQTSYDVALADLRRTTGARIAKRQAELLVLGAALDFEDFYLSREREPEDSRDLLVLTFDGAGIVMRPEGLRPETRRRARSRRPTSMAKSAAGAGPGRRERQHRKRMAEVAAVYSLEAVPRDVDDVLRELGRTGPHTLRPRARNKRVWASVERSVLDVVDEAFCEALNRDPHAERRWVAVVDGNLDQIAAIERCAANTGAEVTVVLDLLHVLGYLWQAGKVLAGADEQTVEAWVQERARRILSGEASHVAAGIRRSATRRRLSKRRRKPIDDCARYLLNHRDLLRYDEYLRDGLPIATGVIEGACRSLVKDRMDITGARWGLEGAEAVLKLRSLRASHDLEDYLAYHHRRELEENHLVHYALDELAELREAA